MGYEEARVFPLGVKKRPKVRTEFDRKTRADETWEKFVMIVIVIALLNIDRIKYLTLDVKISP